MRNRPIFAAAAVVLAVGVSLAGCAPTTSESAGLSIVASTNVWGDIAQTIAGDRAEITSIITSSAQDPHSYETSARDQLAISRADLVIKNGGGFDPFIDTLLDTADSAETAVVINASEASGLMPVDPSADADASAEDNAASHVEGFNEHVWYSFDGVAAIAAEIARELSVIDPNNAAEYQANYEAFFAELTTLTARATTLGTEVGGQSVAITEPVPLYLLEAINLTNATPEAFSEAFEEGIDIPPTALRDTLALFTNGAVVLLAYNDQTTSGQGELVLDAATSAGIPVVSFSETLPNGQDYVSWMTANVNAVGSALAS